MKGLVKKFHLNGKTIGFYQKTQESQRGILWIPIDRVDRRILWGLKFSISGREILASIFFGGGSLI